MAGIYIHIPFCKQACHYCDFHFSTQIKNKETLVASLVKELVMRQPFLATAPVETIYFGGGTPSLLSNAELHSILDTVHKHYTVLPGCEITLEANPDDLTTDNLLNWKQTGINRLSVGVQSFDDTHLLWMNRSHSAAQAYEGIKTAQDSGITNISLDLIYGFTLLTDAQWQWNIEQALGLDVPHISAYMLTIEPRTVLNHYVKKGTYTPGEDAFITNQFITLHNTLEQAGYNHYEVSNYAKPNQQSRHNSAYWKGAAYLGIGPSAHSYNGTQRLWNVSNNIEYIKAIEHNTLPLTEETLGTKERINEFLLTGLRTQVGISLAHFEDMFGTEAKENLLNGIKEFTHKQWLVLDTDRLYPTLDGYLMADHIAASLFVG